MVTRTVDGIAAVLPRSWGSPRHHQSMTEPPSLRTNTAPPYRDYLTEGVTRSEALDACDRIADETPEVAPAYLR